MIPNYILDLVLAPLNSYMVFIRSIQKPSITSHLFFPVQISQLSRAVYEGG